MKKHFLLKSGCSILIGLSGLLIPLTAVQAVEGDRVIEERLDSGGTGNTQSTTPSDETTTRQYDDQSIPQGAQGPMRSDMAMDKSASERERTNQRDISDPDRSPYLVPESEGGQRIN